MAQPLQHVLDLSDADWVRLERIAHLFEEAWRQGRRPRIEDFLPAVTDDDHRSVLIELVHAELEFRVSRGEPARVEEYLQRYPALAEDRLVVWELIAAEVELRRLQDPNLARDEYPARFPDFAAELATLWQNPAAGSLAGLSSLRRAAREPAPGRATSLGIRDERTTARDRPSPMGRTRLGKFELLEVLGRGAFGIVYRAWDTESQRVLALKVPRPDLLATPEEADRFLREARSVIALDHPCIVGAYEAGRIDETYYLASELIPGSTLADRLSTHSLNLNDGVEALAQVAEALDLAHRQGVIHRDLKPSNILLDPGGRPHITDFGLAKRAGGADADSAVSEPTLTLEGQVLGTPAYMSPEQARGEANRVDGRSDVYSLGVILYQLLTGDLPFRGNARMILHQVLHDDPRPPRALNDRIPRDLETICLKAMAKEPAGRYPTAGALADDLRRALRGEPIWARPVKAWQRWARRARARPAVSALLALVAIVTVVGFAGVLWQWHQAEKARQATAEIARAEAQARAQLEVNLYVHLVALAERELSANNVGRAEELLNECTPALRGWEWFFLKRLRLGAIRDIRDQTGLIFDIVFNPDGRTLASAGGDGNVKIWDAETGDQLQILKGHTDSVHGVAFRPDGKMLASCGGGGAVRLWDCATGAQIQTFTGHPGIVYAVAFSPDGRALASAGGDGVVKIWDVKSGRERAALRCGSDAIYGIAFSPDGRWLAAGGGDSAVRLWAWPHDDGADLGAVLSDSERVLRGHPDAVFDVAFSPDSKTLASGGGAGIVKLWDVQEGRELPTLRGHSGVVFGLAFSPDGRRLASASADRTTKLWDVATGQEILTLHGHSDVIWSVAFSPDGWRLADADADGRVKIRDATPPDESSDLHLRVLRGHANGIRCVAFSRSGRRLVSADGGGIIRLWDVASGRVLRILHGHAGVIYSVAFSADGRHLASAGGDGAVKLWDVRSGREALELRIKSSYSIASVAFSPDSRTLAAAGGDGNVRLWDVQTGREIGRLRASPLFTVTSVAYSPDGQRLASAGGDGVVKLWDTATNQEVLTLPGEVRYLKCVVFSPDGRHVAAAGGDAILRVWDATSGQEIHNLHGHSESYLYSIAYSPDGRYLVSADGGGILRVWDVASNREVNTLSGHTGIVYSVAFSPDGRTLASCSWDKTIKLWDLIALTTPPRGR